MVFIAEAFVTRNTTEKPIEPLLLLEGFWDCQHWVLPGSSPGGSREFEAGTASARIRKQLLN